MHIVPSLSCWCGGCCCCVAAAILPIAISKYGIFQLTDGCYWPIISIFIEWKTATAYKCGPLSFLSFDWICIFIYNLLSAGASHSLARSLFLALSKLICLCVRVFVGILFLSILFPFLLALIRLLVDSHSFPCLMSTSVFTLGDDYILSASKFSFVWIWFWVPYISESKWKKTEKTSPRQNFFRPPHHHHQAAAFISVSEFIGTFHWYWIKFNAFRLETDESASLWHFSLNRLPSSLSSWTSERTPIVIWTVVSYRRLKIQTELINNNVCLTLDVRFCGGTVKQASFNRSISSCRTE